MSDLLSFRGEAHVTGDSSEFKAAILPDWLNRAKHSV